MRKLFLITGMILLGVAPLLAQQDSIEKAYATSLTFEKKGDYKSALKVMRHVYDSTDYELNLKMGYLCYYSQAYKESKSYYRKAINLMPDAVEPRMGFVYTAAMLADWDEVKDQYRHILNIDPNNSFVNYNLGLIFYNNREYATAYKHFEKVYKLYPFDYANMLMFAWCNLQLFNNVEAKKLFKKVLLLSPYDKSALEGLKLIK